MKTAGRTLAILAVALLVTGGLLALRQTGLLGGLLPLERHGPGFERGAPPASGFDVGGEGRGEHGGHGPDLLGIVEALKSLATMAVIVALVVAVAGTLGRRAARRDRPPPAANPPA